MYADTHCHLTEYPNPREVIANCNFVELIVGVTNGISSYKETVSISSYQPNIIPALGFHPHLILEQRAELDIMISQIETCSMVGEIGLDHYITRDEYLQELQQHAFRKILAASERHGKCVSVHSKGAEEIVINELEKYGLRHVILHWYSGSLDILKRIIDNGYYVSITPSITYSKKSQELAKQVPLDLLLAESDGPTMYQGLMGSPCDVANVVTRISTLRPEDSSDVSAAIWKNSHVVLSL